MLGSPILDLAIGMAFIYLLLSLIASVVQEIIASITQARAANLERGLHSLFSGDPLQLTEDGKPGKLFVQALYEHGLVRGLYQDPHHDFKGKEPPRPTRMEKFQLAFRRALRSFLNVTPPGYVAKPNDLLLPAYIPARTFALALTDLLNDNKGHWDSLQNIEAHLLELKRRNQTGMETAKADPQAHAAASLADKAAAYENKAVEALYALLLDAGGKADKFQANLENWYNDSMDRASGWYKRYTQKILLCLGLVIAIAFNVDSIHVARTLWFDHDARVGLANAADTYIKNHPDFASTSPYPAATLQTKSAPAKTPTPKPDANGESTADGAAQTSDASAEGKDFDALRMKQGLEDTVNTFNTVSQNSMLPIGWRRTSNTVPAPGAHWYEDIGRWILMFLGWCITAAALSLGAPFWFDMLNKIMVVRNTVKPSEKSPNEASKS